MGGGMAWAKLSSALEPYAFDRRIFGFDTFEGFPDVDEKDMGVVENDKAIVGGFATDYDVYTEINDAIEEYDENRFLNQFQKVFLVRGDALRSIPQFVEDNPHLMISLLFLDFDLYEPTKIALQYFIPRMPKGSIVAFDELNNPWWPGETLAALEMLDISSSQVKRFSFDPNISYIII